MADPLSLTPDRTLRRKVQEVLTSLAGFGDDHVTVVLGRTATDVWQALRATERRADSASQTSLTATSPRSQTTSITSS